MNVEYSGYCPGGINAAKLECAVLRTPFPTAMVDLLDSAENADASTVLVKHYDYLLAPDAAELDLLGAREAMVFSADIRRKAEDKIIQKFFVKSVAIKEAEEGKSGKSGESNGADDRTPSLFLAAHLRRGDFTKVRGKTTPELAQAALQIARTVVRDGLTGRVFIATDMNPEERKKFEDLLEFASDGTIEAVFGGTGGTGPEKPLFQHPGKQALAEIWVAARAAQFIGTQESRFSSAIQLERSFLHQPVETSEQEFCKEAVDCGFPETEKSVYPPVHKKAPGWRFANRVWGMRNGIVKDLQGE